MTRFSLNYDGGNAIVLEVKDGFIERESTFCDYRDALEYLRERGATKVAFGDDGEVVEDTGEKRGGRRSNSSGPSWLDRLRSLIYAGAFR